MMEIEAVVSDPKPTLQNVVSTVNLGCKLILKDIALKARNAEYNPKRFSAVIMRIREPKTTALFFESGRMVCTGAKTIESSKIAAKKFARIMQKLGFPAKFMNFTVHNIVSSCDLGFPIQLKKLACSGHGAFISYEPELFPGLVYRIKNSKIIALVFASGKVVIAGAKNVEESFVAFDNIFPVIQQFKRCTCSNVVTDLPQEAPPPSLCLSQQPSV